MNFFIKCYIPSLKKEIYINKITFGDYFQLNLYIQNNDIYNISKCLNSICEKATEESKNFSVLDKFSILVHLYDYYLNNIIKLIGKDVNDNNTTIEVFIKTIIDNIKKYDVDMKLPKNFYYNSVNDILKETYENKENIKKHIEKNKIQMFFVPDFIKGIPKVYLNCFDNSLFKFLKLLYSEKIENIYKKIKFLKKNCNFQLSEIYNITPKEVELFLSNK